MCMSTLFWLKIKVTVCEMRQRKPAEYHNLPINLTLSCKTPLFNKSHKSDIRSEFYGGVRAILFYSSHCENRLSLSTNRLHSVLGIAYILYRIASFTVRYSLYRIGLSVLSCQLWPRNCIPAPSFASQTCHFCIWVGQSLVWARPKKIGLA